MAEHAVNLSFTSRVKPNFFEVIAQESLMTSLDPAVKVICNFVASKNPAKYGWLIRWYDELFLATNSILQYYYLKYYNASFSEAYYSLQRVLDNKNGQERLNSKALSTSFFFLTAFPYLVKKINSYCDNYEKKVVNQNISAHTKKKKLFPVKFVTYLGRIHNFLKFVFLFRYLASLDVHYHPHLKISGVKLIYQKEDLVAWHDRMLSENKLSVKILPFTLKSLMTLFEISAFCIQFLKWWHTDETRGRVTRMPVPKPPHTGQETTTICPLCRNYRKNEVVLLTSGRVFCYSCIKTYLDEHHTCPVTRLPSSSDHLVKIFSDD